MKRSVALYFRWAVFCLLALALLTATSCGDNGKSAWERSVQQNTPGSYRQFIQQYPKSEFTRPAQEKLFALEDEAWKASLSEKDSDSAIKQYLSLFPDGKHVAIAATVLELRAALPKYFDSEVEKVRVAIAEALRRRSSSDSSAKLNVGKPIYGGVDRRTGRSLVLCPVTQRDANGQLKVLAGDTVFTARLVFDLRRSSDGAWPANVGDVLLLDPGRLAEDMTKLLAEPIQMHSGEWKLVGVGWNLPGRAKNMEAE